MATHGDRVFDESEDLFASQAQAQADSESQMTSRLSAMALVADKDGCEMTAAAALTSLVSSPSPSGQYEGQDECQEEDNDDDDDMEDEKGFTIPQRFTKSGRKRAVSFVLKLMKVLSNKKYENIIKWMPSGKSFNIVDPKRFVAEVLPEHFKSAKYSSFTRKLHRWGFMRHYRGEEAGAFFHKNFQRDRLDMVEKMSCYKVDAPKAPATTSAQRKPDMAAPRTTGAFVPPRSIVAPTPFPQLPRGLPPPQQPMGHAPMHHHPGVAPGMGLDAVIEMEVSRRLKERINAASMSRHALAMMHHPTEAPGYPYPHQQEHAHPPLPPHPPQPYGHFNQPGPTQFMPPMNRQGMSFKYDRSPVPLAPAYGDTQPLSSLPMTNIQGAKTA